MMIKRTVMSALFVAMMSFGLATTINQNVSAQPAPQSGAGECGSGGLLGFPGWYRGICEGAGEIKSPNDPAIGGIGNFIWVIVLNVIDIMLRLTGYISLGFIIVGGFKYMISGDNASGTAAARKTILNAVIGLVLSIMAVAIVNVVVSSIGGTIG